MSVRQVLKIESDVVTESSIKIPFEFKEGTYPEGKNPGNCIIISPITVRTAYRMRPLLNMIDKKDLDLVKARDNVIFDADLCEIMNKYEDVIFDIVCIGLYNKKGIMPDWFKECLKDNCTWKDIYILLNAILYRLGCNSFLNSITALRVVSPLSEEEIIALQKNRESWIRKA